MQCGKLKTYLETGRVIFVPIRSIHPNPSQPREVFDQEELQQVADSIRSFGVLQPLPVRRRASGYELIAGKRYLRGAELAGMEEVPWLLMTMDDGMSALTALVENLQRKDLDYIEEARGLARLMELSGCSQEQATRKVGKSQSAVANKLRLLRHSLQVLEALRSYGLTERYARALLKLTDEVQKIEVIDWIRKENLTVSQTEAYIDRICERRQNQTKKAGTPNVRAFLTELTENLAKIQRAGISAVSHRQETEHEITLTITISKE